MVFGKPSWTYFNEEILAFDVSTYKRCYYISLDIFMGDISLHLIANNKYEH